MHELGPRKELFDLTKFDGAKLLQVEVKLLEVNCLNLTCILCTLNGGNTCFSDIGNLELVKNIIRGSNLVHQMFGVKFHHCYAFFQKSVCEFKNGNK